jgi:hypothetical protein
VENDSATPKSGLSDRTTESSSQPSTGVVIFDSDYAVIAEVRTSLNISDFRQITSKIKSWK